MDVHLFVPGIARTAGSKRAFPIYRGKKGEERTFTGHVAIVDDAGAKGKQWRHDVQWMCRAKYSGPPEQGAIRLSLRFVSVRPKCHHRASGAVKDDAPLRPTTKPDLLKLARSIEDALTGILWVDDAQIVTEHLEKEYGSTPGVWISAMTLL
jgi:Holliday junction resolvase RusA-like endonuclease